MDTIILKIDSETFTKVPQQYRKMFEVLKVEPDDKELFEGDMHFSKLMKVYRKAAKELRDYQFDKRHK